MENGTYSLRIHPKFEIELLDDSIKIMDSSESESNSFFALEKIETFEIKQKRTNWLITILSFVLEIFSSISTSDKYSEGSQLHLVYEGESFKYYLNDCDLNLMSKIENHIKKRIQ